MKKRAGMERERDGKREIDEKRVRMKKEILMVGLRSMEREQERECD